MASTEEWVQIPVSGWNELMRERKELQARVKELESGPPVAVPEKVEVNRDDLESLLDTYDRPGNEVTARLRAVLEQERGRGMNPGIDSAAFRATEGEKP